MAGQVLEEDPKTGKMISKEIVAMPSLGEKSIAPPPLEIVQLEITKLRDNNKDLENQLTNLQQKDKLKDKLHHDAIRSKNEQIGELSKNLVEEQAKIIKLVNSLIDTKGELSEETKKFKKVIEELRESLQKETATKLKVEKLLRDKEDEHNSYLSQKEIELLQKTQEIDQLKLALSDKTDKSELIEEQEKTIAKLKKEYQEKLEKLEQNVRGKNQNIDYLEQEASKFISRIVDESDLVGIKAGLARMEMVFSSIEIPEVPVEKTDFIPSDLDYISPDIFKSDLELLEEEINNYVEYKKEIKKIIQKTKDKTSVLYDEERVNEVIDNLSKILAGISLDADLDKKIENQQANLEVASEKLEEGVYWKSKLKNKNNWEVADYAKEILRDIYRKNGKEQQIPDDLKDPFFTSFKSKLTQWQEEISEEFTEELFPQTSGLIVFGKKINDDRLVPSDFVFVGWLIEEKEELKYNTEPKTFYFSPFISDEYYEDVLQDAGSRNLKIYQSGSEMVLDDKHAYINCQVDKEVGGIDVSDDYETLFEPAASQIKEEVCLLVAEDFKIIEVDISTHINLDEEKDFSKNRQDEYTINEKTKEVIVPTYTSKGETDFNLNAAEDNQERIDVLQDDKLPATTFLEDESGEIKVGRQKQDVENFIISCRASLKYRLNVENNEKEGDGLGDKLKEAWTSLKNEFPATNYNPVTPELLNKILAIDES
ncbi:17078_t:CDS:10, partial [Racocetra persica]